MTGCTTPLSTSSMSIGDENDNLESHSDVGTVYDKSARNTLPSTEFLRLVRWKLRYAEFAFGWVGNLGYVMISGWLGGLHLHLGY